MQRERSPYRLTYRSGIDPESPESVAARTRIKSIDGVVDIAWCTDGREAMMFYKGSLADLRARMLSYQDVFCVDCFPEQK